jgi:hypothetical protein
LKLGRYTIRETAAPASYTPDPDVQTVEFTLSNPAMPMEVPAM